MKICGITREEDLQAALAAGADAVGFINVPGGSRYLEAGRIADLLKLVPPFVTPVVVVDLTDPLHQDRAEALRFLCGRGLRCVQFHGHEPPWEIARLRGLFGLTAIKALRLANLRDLAMLDAYAGAVDAFLVEGAAGKGIACDWDLAAEAARRQVAPLILAGGLTPDNVSEAILRVRPHAVDVSSGVEVKPGLKDPVRIAAFVSASRQASGTLAAGA